LAAVDAATGSVVKAFHSAVNGQNDALSLTPAGLYIGGGFTTVSKAARPLPWLWHVPAGGGTHPFQTVSLIADANGCTRPAPATAARSCRSPLPWAG